MRPWLVLTEPLERVRHLQVAQARCADDADGEALRRGQEAQPHQQLARLLQRAAITSPVAFIYGAIIQGTAA